VVNERCLSSAVCEDDAVEEAIEMREDIDFFLLGLSRRGGCKLWSGPWWRERAEEGVLVSDGVVN